MTLDDLTDLIPQLRRAGGGNETGAGAMPVRVQGSPGAEPLEVQSCSVQQGDDGPYVLIAGANANP